MRDSIKNSNTFYYLDRIFFSTVVISFVADMLNALASWNIVTKEGCLCPHSRREIKLRSRLLISASFSWENWYLFLNSLMTSPNAPSRVIFDFIIGTFNRMKGNNLLTIDNTDSILNHIDNCVIPISLIYFFRGIDILRL